MVTARRVSVLLSAGLGLAALVIAPSRAQETVLYRQALEAYDYGKWREATILFETAATERGVDDLRHYSQRRLQDLAPTDRLEQEILPRELAALAVRLERQRRLIALLEESAESLPRAGRDGWAVVLREYESEVVPALIGRHSELAAELPLRTPAGRERDPLERFSGAVALFARTLVLRAEVVDLEHELEGAKSVLRGKLVKRLMSNLERRGSAHSAIGPNGHRLHGVRAVFARNDASKSFASRPSCGYSADDAQARTKALSDYLAGSAIAETQSCREIRAIALPRLQCALDGWPVDQISTGDDALLARTSGLEYWPNRSLSLSAARCGDREAARTFLERHKRNRGAEAASDPMTTAIAHWLAGKIESYPGRSRAVVIGAWDYLHWPDLPGAKTDYEQLQIALSAQGFTVQAIANPSREQLRRLIERLEQTTRPSDRLIVYYAGHGHLSRSEKLDVEVGWIVPTDAPPSDSPLFPSYGVSMDQVRKWSLFDLDDVHQQLFVFDSCFAGQLFLDSDRLRRCKIDPVAKRRALDFPFLSGGGASPGTVRWLESQPVRIWMSAGSASQRVTDRSNYSQLLVRSLSGLEPHVDANQDGYLLADTELAPFLRGRARGTWAQTPQAEALCGEGDFVFHVADGLAMAEPAFSQDRCAANPLATLEDVFRWEALSRVGAYAEYLESSRCGIFSALSREMVKRQVDR